MNNLFGGRAELSYYVVLTSATRKQSFFWHLTKLTNRRKRTSTWHLAYILQWLRVYSSVRKVVMLESIPTRDNADCQENDRCNPHLVAVFVLLPVSHVHSLQLNEESAPGGWLIFDWFGVKLQGTKTSARFHRKRDLHTAIAAGEPKGAQMLKQFLKACISSLMSFLCIEWSDL